MNCENCSGSCEKCNTCGGCHGSELTLTRGEIEMLQLLGQLAFLPVARKASDMVPVCLETGLDREQATWILQMLEKKQLIDIRYDPLPGADMSAYKGLPVHGSMALTQRGQLVLDLLDIQGCED